MDIRDPRKSGDVPSFSFLHLQLSKGNVHDVLQAKSYTRLSLAGVSLHHIWSRKTCAYGTAPDQLCDTPYGRSLGPSVPRYKDGEEGSICFLERSQGGML